MKESGAVCQLDKMTLKPKPLNFIARHDYPELGLSRIKSCAQWDLER